MLLVGMGVGGFGAPELLIILAIILLLFGAGRLTGLGRAMGQSIVEFRRASHDADGEERKRPEDDRRSAREGDRSTASAAASTSIDGARDREYRSIGTASAPPQSAPGRPPDFTGR